MSYRHINLQKISETEKVVSYKIFCPDFNDDFQEEEMGVLEIDKEAKNFVHTKDELWLKNKIYPIKIFALDPQSREAELKGRYADFAGGAWSKSLFDFIQICMREDFYPDRKALVG